MKEEPQYRKMPLYASLICGLIVLLTGIYLTITQKFLHGLTLPGARSGTGGAWKPVALPGIGIITIGLLISFYPAYLLIKSTNKKSDN